MKIIYTKLPLSSFEVASSGDDSLYFSSSYFAGQKIYPSARFWRSLWNELKVDENLFDYFSSAEIFASVALKNGGQLYRFCVEDHGAYGRLLGLSSLITSRQVSGSNKLLKSFVSVETITKDIAGEETVEAGYHDGQIYSVGRLGDVPRFRRLSDRVAAAKKKSSHATAAATGTAAEGHATAAAASGVVETLSDMGISPCFLRRQPIDGLGFGSFCYGVSIGDGHLFFDSVKTRVMSQDGVNCTDKFASLRSDDGTKGQSEKHSVHEAVSSRLAHAHDSAASLGEIAEFYRVLDRNDVSIARFDAMLAHPFEAFGLASYNSLSKTRLSRLPTRGSVLELLEVMAAAAGDLSQTGRTQLYRLAGSMIASYYDFEGMAFSEVVGKELKELGDKGESESSEAPAAHAAPSASSVELVGAKVEVDISSLDAPRGDDQKPKLRLVTGGEKQRKLA